jgi:hypothetical protein
MYLTFLSLALAFSNEIKKNVISIFAGVVGAFVFFTVGREYALKIVYYFYALFLSISLLIATINLVWKGIISKVWKNYPCISCYLRNLWTASATNTNTNTNGMVLEPLHTR